jgi:hypothetical protein
MTEDHTRVLTCFSVPSLRRTRAPSASSADGLISSADWSLKQLRKYSNDDYWVDFKSHFTVDADAPSSRCRTVASSRFDALSLAAILMTSSERTFSLINLVRCLAPSLTHGGYLSTSSTAAAHGAIHNFSREHKCELKHEHSRVERSGAGLRLTRKAPEPGPYAQPIVSVPCGEK